MKPLCQKEGCKHEATHVPVLNVPAKDWPIDLHQPMRLVMDIGLCRDHARAFGDDFKLADNPQLREAMKAAAAGRQPPDFDRLFFTSDRIGSEFHATLRKMQAQAGRPQRDN